MSIDGLGVIAGEGALPRLIAEDCARRDARYLVCAFEGQAPGWLDDHPHLVTPFEKPGRLFSALRDADCRHVTMAGAMSRPRLNPLAFDLAGLRLASRILPLLKKGDDALLRGVMAALEREGFVPLGAHEVLAALLAAEGPLSDAQPDAQAHADIARAAALTRLIGGADVGQAAVVADGVCLGLETVQGTDAMLSAVAATPPERRTEAAGVLFKGVKPGQDWRADLPAIGPETLRRAAQAGLGGVAVEAGSVLILGREACRAEADRLGLFLFGWTG